MANTICNSAAGVSVYYCNGTAMPTGGNATLDNTVMMASANAQTSTVTVVGFGKTQRNAGSKVVPTSACMAAILSAGAGTGTIRAGTSGGYLNYLASGHGLSAGDCVWVVDTSGACDGIQKVISAGTNNFTTDKPSTFYANAGTLSYYQKNSSYTFANQQAGKYIMINGGANAESLAGVANALTKLRTNGIMQKKPNLFYPQSIRKTTTAIRSGWWNPTTGKFTSLVQNASAVMLYRCDTAAVAAQTTDNGNVNPGELCFTLGGTPIQDDYAGRGQY